MRKSKASSFEKPSERGDWTTLSDPLLPGMRLDQIGQALAGAYDDLVAEGVPEHLAGLVRRVRSVEHAGPGKGERLVLVVEDEVEVRSLAEAVLEETELAVLGCDSAERALAILQERGTDVALVFADIRLAGAMDGIQLANAIATLWPQTRLIITSGVALERGDEIPPGAVFIAKPWRALDVLVQAEHAAEDVPSTAI